MRKWMNFETRFKSLKEDLTVFLKKNNIIYEVSGCYDGYHFEIFVNDNEVKQINQWLDDNTITEK